MTKKISFLPRQGGTRVFESNEDVLIDDIVRAVPSVSEGDYTADKKPRVAALEQLLGVDITEAQRDRAFEIHLMKTGNHSQLTTTESPEVPADETGDADETD